MELTLQLDPALLNRLWRHPAIHRWKLQKPATRTLQSVTFDTPDFHLHRRNIALSILHDGRKRLQKITTAVHGQWQWPITGDWPEPPPPDSAAAAAALGRHWPPRGLRPMFTAAFRRSLYRLGDVDWDIEMTVDHGDLVAGSAQWPVCRLGLRLTRGTPAQLLALALELADSLPLGLAPGSLEDGGYDRLAGEPVGVTRATSVTLAEETSTAEAFRTIAVACVGQLAANHGCLLASGEPEATHQMRVALRRLRSAMGVFKDVLILSEVESLRPELRWLQQVLGAARDTDVFIEEILIPVDRLYQDFPEYGRLRAFVMARQQQARETAAVELATVRCTKLLLRLAVWAETATLTDAPEALQPARLLAEITLAKRHRRVKKAMRDLAELDEAARHRCRIEVKKLRYAVEFFASLFPEAKSGRLVSALGRLQDRLGVLNDIVIGRGLLRRLAEESGDRDLLWIGGMIAGWHAGRVGELLGQAADDWKACERLKRFWVA